MATYKIIGCRYLRKYTAEAATPVYSAAIDAQKVVDSLCGIPWEKSGVKRAEMPVHGADENVADREKFDAALFCAGHKDGKHTAYANAACYKFTFPDSAIEDGYVCDTGGNPVTMSQFVASVTSDPYNSQGARIALLTNSTGIIPTNCNTCRTGDVHVEGVAPRTSRTVSGTEYWYCTTADATLEPEGSLNLQKYVFLFVVMESYSTVRGNWLEGSSLIENLCTLTTSAGVKGWTDGETYDLSDDATITEFNIARGGVYPKITGNISGVKGAVVMRNGDDLRLGGIVEHLMGGEYLCLKNGVCSDARPNSITGFGPPWYASEMRSAVKSHVDIVGRTVSDPNAFYDGSQWVLVFSEDVAYMPPGRESGGMTAFLAGVRWRNVQTGGDLFPLPIPTDQNGADLASACAVNGVRYAFTESGRALQTRYARFHIFPGDGYEYVFDQDTPIYNSSYRAASCTKTARSGVPICNTWTKGVYLEGNALICDDFPASIPVIGEVTAMHRMYDVDQNAKVKNGVLKFIVSGALEKVGGVSCRNCAIITIASGTVSVSVPSFANNITPDTYVNFAVVPKTPKVVNSAGVVVATEEGYNVTGSFASLGGVSAHGFATINENGTVTVGDLVVGTNPIMSIVGAMYIAGDGLFFTGVEYALMNVVWADDIPSGVSETQSCIGLRELYERLYDGKMFDVAMGSKERNGAGFIVESTTQAVNVLDDGDIEEQSVPVWKMSLSSLVVPFSVPFAFKARRLRLDWSDWLGSATSGCKFNVWMKRDAWITDGPAETLKKPTIYDATAQAVDGWELVGVIDATQGTSATFELSKVLEGYVATLMFTAFINLDRVNPSSSTATEYGTTGFSADIIENAVEGLQYLWKPDITLIG